MVIYRGKKPLKRPDLFVLDKTWEYEESLRIDKSKDEQARKERSKAEVS